MNYTQHYTRLVERSKNRLFTDYTETHHILPRCMGGMDCVDNLVELTPEEHYVAHQLLAKMHPHEPKLIFAANMMTVGARRNNKRYAWLKRKAIAALVGRVVSDTTKQKLSTLAIERIRRDGHPRGMKGKHHTAEAKHDMSINRLGENNGMYGHTHSPETIEKMKNRVVSEHTKKLISDSKVGDKHPNYGKTMSGVTKQKISDGVRNSLSVSCPHCGAIGKKSPMARWHFDNCRLKETV